MTDAAPKNVSAIYFSDPRLNMTSGGRFIVRTAGNIAYGLTAAAALVCMAFTDLRPLQAAGVLLALFLGDRLLHAGESEKLLFSLPAGRINAAEYLTPASYRALEAAFDRALWLGDDFALRLMQELVRKHDVVEGLARMDIAAEDLSTKIQEHLARGETKQKQTREAILEEIENVVAAAFAEAASNHSASIEPHALFAALHVVQNQSFLKLLTLFNVESQDLAYALTLGRLRRLGRSGTGLHAFVGKRLRRRHRTMNRAWTARPTPTLDGVSDDLTDRARGGEGALLFGHEREYRQLVDVLSRPGNPHALLVGPPGAGKGPILTNLAYKIIKDRVPPPLFDRRLVALEIGSLVAGAEPEAVADRMKRIVEEIVVAGNIILCIPDMHNLIKTGGAGRISAADVLIPAIKNAGFSVVGASYPREFKQYLEPSSDFIGSFEVIRVDEISREEALRFLTFSAALLEAQYRIVISFNAIKEAVSLAHKYFREKLLPQSAEELLKEAIADAAEKGKKTLAASDVIAMAERRVNVPIHEAGAGEAKKLLELERIIHERFIDQEPAVKAVAEALREYRSGLSRKGGPVAQFLFVGPTGVGKTELAKILAEIMFGSVAMMTRFDMSEYQTKESIARLIGSPDGSVRGSLTDAVYEKPYSLILLDEFEKAHPDLLNLFLQVFDDGRLTDNFGRTVDFTNTVIIATSNAHADILMDALRKGESVPKVADYLKTKLVDFFKPELLNRFTDIIVFQELSPEHLRAIARIQVNELAATLKTEHQIDLSFDDAAVDELARRGYDPVYGARPLRRAIADSLRGPLAEKILKGELKKGMDVRMGLKDGAFTFTATEL